MDDYEPLPEPPPDLAPKPSPFARKKGEPSTRELLGNLNRELPYSDEAEKGVLSAIIQDPEDRIHSVRVDLPAEAFYHEANRICYEQILACADANLPIDVPLLTNRMRDKDLLNRVGGPAALTDLFTFVPSPAHFEHYLKIVRDKWHVRCAIDAHSRAISDLQTFNSADEDRDVRDVILDGEAKVFRVVEATQKGGSAGPVHSAVVVEEVMQHILKLREAGIGKLMGISTGWPDVDRAIGGQGLEAGDVFVIGARPKMGKTNVLCTMTKSFAVDQGIPTLVLSLEMSRRRLWNRILFGGFGIETTKASNGFLEKAKGDKSPREMEDEELFGETTGMARGDQENLERGRRLMSKAPLFIHDEAMNTNDLRATVRLMVRRHGIKVIMLDYVQLVDPVTKIGMSEERHQIAEVMKVIHGLKRSLGLTFVVLAQAARGAESNPRHEPGPKDFDGSSSIEKYLDYGAFIHRPARYKRWGDLDDKAQQAFRRIVEPLRKANPEQWSEDVPIRDGLGKVVKTEPIRDGEGNVIKPGVPKMEWDIENDWNEHALLLLCLNRNGDEGRIWLRFRPKFTRFDARNTDMYSNNASHRQPGLEDKFTAAESGPKKGGRRRELTADEVFRNEDEPELL